VVEPSLLRRSSTESRESPASGRLGLIDRILKHFGKTSTPFEMVFPDGGRRNFGEGPPSFTVTLRNRHAVRALASMDEGRVGDAYIEGHLDLEGDMLRPFEIRGSMSDRHYAVTAWRFLQPLLFGQVRTNRRAIADHYDIDSDFFLSFLDRQHPLYTQGMFNSSDETLSEATRRKFDYCFEQLHLKPGDHVLEIGPGWGAWFEYASQRNVKCTGLTISTESANYLRRRAAALGHDWSVVECDLLAYETTQKYDAIVCMGVIEHLPQYGPVLGKFASLLKPGGLIFLDGSACTKKYELSTFMVKYIYGGNHSFLVLHDFLAQMARTPLRVRELHNDRYDYFLTFQHWAMNFERNRQEVIQRFGDFNYRRFRLYLWGAAYEFLSGSLDCYRMIIEYPTFATPQMTA
jgi:cyclopropane-fatty-acyl-phospholipid synthase